MPFFFHIIDDYYFILKAIEDWQRAIQTEINSAKHKEYLKKLNRLRPSGSKGRWQKAISVQPSRAGPLARSNI
jgi:hypothetical protein